MTDIILKAEGIKDALSVEFYIERENVIKIDKEDFIKVFLGNAIEYYLPVDANCLGRGHVMAAVEFADRENAYPGRERKVVVNGFTGYTIPCMGEGNTIGCSGYEVSFEAVQDIPRSDAVIHYGVMTDDFERIEMRVLTRVKDIEEIELSFKAGERMVVLIPYDRDEVVKKDNGFGGKVPFSTSVDGRNGEVAMLDDGMKYKVYGELMIVDGTLKLYIE